MRDQPAAYFLVGERVTVRTVEGLKARGTVVGIDRRDQPHWSLVHVQFDLSAYHPAKWDAYDFEARCPEPCRTFYAAALASALA